LYTLITAASSAQAYKLKNQLSIEAVLLGDYVELPAFMLSNAHMIKLPNPVSAAYTHEMLTLCLDKQIDTVYALKEQEQALLKQAEQLFNEYGISIVDS
jgi:hypothetical protein